MPNFAQLDITGHMGKDPQQRQAGKHSVVSFSVAYTSKRKGESTTLWVKCNCWNKLGDTAMAFLSKGDAVRVIGEPSLSEWTGQDGTKRTTLELNARDIVLLGSKAGRKDHSEQRPEGDLGDMEDGDF